MTKTTPEQLIDWVDVQIRHVDLMRDKSHPDPYFDTQEEMFRAVRKFLVTHTKEVP